VGKGPLIIGGMLGLGALGWALARPAAAAPPAGPRSVVTTSVKVRRGVRQRWRGAGTPPAGLTPAPKYKVGDKLVIRNPPEPGVEPDAAVEGKPVVVMEAINYEVVGYGPDGAVTVLPLPGSWGYVTNLTVDGQPVIVAETSLHKA
jgi:hypothetical protein